jgi:hypothetical protein
MKELLSVTFISLLLAGCGEEAQKKTGQNETAQNKTKDDPNVPLAIPCVACGEKVSKKTTECRQCGHPTPDSVVAYKKAQEEERRIKSYGGPVALAKIKEAKESDATKLDLRDLQISDLTPLKGLTNLETLWLYKNQISDLSPLKGLTNLKSLDLERNQISDLSPLAGLTNLKWLDLKRNQISDLIPLAGLRNLSSLTLNENFFSDLSPLKGLTNLKEVTFSGNQIPNEQKALLHNALPKCRLRFGTF